MMPAIALLFAVLLAAIPPMSSVSGEWAGSMMRNGDRLAVRFSLTTAPTASGTFSASDLGAIDIPLQHVVLGSAVQWALAGDTTTTLFRGAVHGDTITGTFSENGRTGTFLLRRMAALAQEPYVKRDVTFHNGDVRLRGTLFLPRTRGQHAALIFVHGSGDEGRWASAYLADDAARHGIIALTYDKRGVGASSGDWRHSAITGLVGDARAGIKLLAETPGVNRHCIGVYGHSQGGEIAPAIAEGNPLVGFVIAADGPVGPQYLQDLYRVDTYLAKRYSGKQLADAKRLYREFVDVARLGAPHETLHTDMQAAGNAAWLADLAIPDDNSWVWAWYARYGNYDNRAAWANVRVPVLILFGGNDELVPVNSSIAQTVQILQEHGNSHISVRVFDNADHTLHVPPRSADGWPHLPSGFPDAVTAFISELQALAKSP